MSNFYYAPDEIAMLKAALADARRALEEIVAHEPDCLCTGRRCSGIARAALSPGGAKGERP